MLIIAFRVYALRKDKTINSSFLAYPDDYILYLQQILGL
jgi:hypothetical protein